MTTEPSKEHRKSHKLEKKIIEIFARTLETVTWLPLFYFYDSGNVVGMLVSILLMVSGIIIDVLND